MIDDSTSMQKETSYNSVYEIDLSCNGYKGQAINFKVDVLTYALDDLINLADDALGIYELSSIRRVGDIWKYLWLRPVELPSKIKERYQCAREKEVNNKYYRHPWPEDQIPFLTFDEWFFWNWDLEAEDEAWLNMRHGDLIKQTLESCYLHIQQAQKNLKASNDILIKSELAAFISGNHKYDFTPDIPFNRSRNDVDSFSRRRLGENYYLKLAEIIRNPSIKSVAYRDGNDFQTLRICCNEQLRRVHELAASIDDFKICAIGNMKVDAEAWGAKVIYYEEGLGNGDLFIQQEKDYGTPVKQLIESGRRSSTSYIFCIKDEGEIQRFDREINKDWVIYSRINPHESEISKI